MRGICEGPRWLREDLQPQAVFFFLGGRRWSREHGDLPRGYQAMHEENFLSSWLREDVDGKEEREKMNKEAAEEESNCGKRDVDVEREKW